MSGSAFAVTHHAFSSGAGRTSDGNGSHASTLKSPSYTKSVSWQHYLMNMVENMLDQAFKKLNPHEHPVLHSDQGWQYRMRRYQNILKEHGIKQSMSRKGNCLDNAVVECFFGTLKSECFYLDEFSNISELKDAVTEYIEYYNSRRISLKLKGLTPIEYRNQTYMPRV